MDNDITRCDVSGTSCYFLNNTALSFASAQKACKRLNGAHLVAWNTQDEQVSRVGLQMCMPVRLESAVSRDEDAATSGGIIGQVHALPYAWGWSCGTHQQRPEEALACGHAAAY